MRCPMTRTAPAAPVREPEPAGNAILLTVAITGGMLALLGCSGVLLFAVFAVSL